MTTIERVKKAIMDKAIESNFKPFTITMKVNGDEIHITPMHRYFGEVTSPEDPIYWLTESPCLPWIGGDLDDLADDLLHYAEKIARRMAEMNALHEFYVEHCDDLDNEWRSEYSDWHKDVYGHRPHHGEH